MSLWTACLKESGSAIIKILDNINDFAICFKQEHHLWIIVFFPDYIIDINYGTDGAMSADVCIHSLDSLLSRVISLTCLCRLL